MDSIVAAAGPSVYRDRDAVYGGLMLTEAGNRISFSPAVGTLEVWSSAGDLIANATRQVALQTYQWERESEAEQEVLIGLQMAGQPLTDGSCRHGRPIKVRILVDELDLPIIGNRQAVIEGIRDLRLHRSPCLDIVVGRYTHSSYDNLHSKSLVVDGAAVMMSANVQTEHAFEPAACIEGPAACALNRELNEAWGLASEYQRIDEVNPDGVTVEEAQGLDDCSEDDEILALCDAGFPGRYMDDVPILITSRRGNPTLLDASGLFPDDIDNSQYSAFRAAIDSARDTIRIATPNLNDNNLLEALQGAVARGVSVKILLGFRMNAQGELMEQQGCKFINGDYFDPYAHLTNPINILFDHDCPPRTNEESVAFLYPVDDTIETCTFLDIRWWVDDTGAVVVGNSDEDNPQLHAKYMSIDGQVVIMGSANLDNRAIDGSREVNIVVDDAELVAEWDRRVFEPRWGNAGVPNKTVEAYWRTCSQCGDGRATGYEECDYCPAMRRGTSYPRSEADCEAMFDPAMYPERHEELVRRCQLNVVDFGHYDACAAGPTDPGDCSQSCDWGG